jgi:hypothetical protein
LPAYYIKIIKCLIKITYIKILSCIVDRLLMNNNTVLLKRIDTILLQWAYVLVLNVIVLSESSTYLLLLAILYIVVRSHVSSLDLTSHSPYWWWVINIASRYLRPSILSDSKLQKFLDVFWGDFWRCAACYNLHYLCFWLIVRARWLMVLIHLIPLIYGSLATVWSWVAMIG